MPTLSMFYGIIIRMYFGPKEHNPPHIHVYYQEFKATFNIHSADLIEGNLPSKQQKLVMAWMLIHQEELLADWELCQKGETPFKIDPLK